MKYPSISYQIAHDIEKATGQETRVTVPVTSREAAVPMPMTV